jgi:hypothetical protein
MRWSSRLILLLLGALALSVQAALPQRTFVASSNGLDTNPCSLVAPCRTFGFAIAAVAVGGEVVVLDSAGYGAVTIAKSVSIVAPPGIYAGVTVASGIGVTVNGAGINVVLRGLSITNLAGNGAIGFYQGASLHVENCVISGFATSASVELSAPSSTTHVIDTIVRDGGLGIAIGANATANFSRTRVEHVDNGFVVQQNAIVSIEDSVITGSANNIIVQPAFSGEKAKLTIARTLISGGGQGVVAQSITPSGHAVVTIMDSTITGTTLAIRASTTAGSASVMAIRNQLQGNSTALWADGPGSTLILDGNAVANNTGGVGSTGGATVVTRSNNTVTANGTDTSGTPYTPIPGI